MAGYDRKYYWKKAWALYPGVLRPVSGAFLAAHYQAVRRRRSLFRALLDTVIGLGFHLWVPLRCWQVARRHALPEGWRRRARAIAHARFADPNDIALFRIARAEELDGYIRRFEDAALNKRLNPAGWTRDCALADKEMFARRCAGHGIAHPANTALWDGSTLEVLEEPAGRHLVAKPVDGEGGDGFADLGAVENMSALRAALAGREGRHIVQPRLFPHPALEDIALAALPTVRIVTIRNEAGKPEVVSATFRCASDPAARVDNMKAGGLIAAVDLAQGRLSVACKGYGGGDYARHPVTQAPLEGRMLPDWQAACDLVRHAHGKAFAEYVIIGWDVALTGDGPVLLEGNGKPGVLMPQRAARRGLGEGRYGQLLAWHLHRTD